MKHGIYGLAELCAACLVDATGVDPGIAIVPKACKLTGSADFVEASHSLDTFQVWTPDILKAHLFISPGVREYQIFMKGRTVVEDEFIVGAGAVDEPHDAQSGSDYRNQMKAKKEEGLSSVKSLLDPRSKTGT